MKQHRLHSICIVNDFQYAVRKLCKLEKVFTPFSGTVMKSVQNAHLELEYGKLMNMQPSTVDKLSRIQFCIIFAEITCLLSIH